MQITAQVLHALRRDLYPAETHVWATEVTVPGIESNRRMDAATICTNRTPFHVEGFEVKVSRSDWRNDMGGEKSLQARNAVDRFWFVFGSPDIYKVEEVPADCGIIHVQGDRAVKVREASQPKEELGTYCRGLLNTILTRTLRENVLTFTKQVEKDAEARGYRKGLSAGKRTATVETKPIKRKYDPGRYNYDDGVPLNLP